MPRFARLDAPGVIHHIIIRGIERRKIFRDNRDQENFLERLGNLPLETKTGCYACKVKGRKGAVNKFINKYFFASSSEGKIRYQPIYLWTCLFSLPEAFADLLLSP